MSSVLFVAIHLLFSVWISNAGCPFAAMMNSYNFSGDWSYNMSTNNSNNDSSSYVMHICHFENNEIYFSLAKNDTADILIGFGSGNWSQSSMMIGGQVFEINNGSTAPHPFGIGMNMQIHKWWIQDPLRSTALDEGKKRENGSNIKICAIPFGVDIRNEYYEKFWNIKRKFHREIRIKKRMKDRERKRRLREEKKKPFYIKYYQQFLKAIGLAPPRNDTIFDQQHNATFVYDEKPDFPTLFGKTWINNDDGLSVTLIDEKNGCFNGELLSNISIAYFGVGVNSFIEKENGIKNGQFFLQIHQNELMGSYITYKLDDNGEIVEDEIKGFTMKQSDKFISCPNTEKKCDQTDGQKCEL